MKVIFVNEILHIVQLFEDSFKQQRKFENFENWKYVIGAITAVLFVCFGLLEAAIKNWSGKVFLKFVQNPWKIHMKEFAFFRNVLG